MINRERPCVGLKVADWPGTWCYWTHLTDLQIGEWVIVESPRNAHGQNCTDSGIPMLGQVNSISPGRQQRAKANKWIVDRVDWDAYRARQALAPMEVE